MTAVALFVAAAMNPELDGWDQDDGLAEDEFMFEGSVFQLGSLDHSLLVAAATVEHGRRLSTGYMAFRDEISIRCIL